jgi:hypothetical protein
MCGLNSLSSDDSCKETCKELSVPHLDQMKSYSFPLKTLLREILREDEYSQKNTFSEISY